MIPNRIFVAAFGVGALALAVYHLTQTPLQIVGIVAPALVGLFLLNLAAGRRRGRGHFCNQGNRMKSSDAPAGQG